MPAGLFFSIYLIVFSAYFAVATDPNEVFFLPGLYSGLTNQRFSFYHSVMVSAAQNWTLVLPSWKMGYNDYIDGFTVPFGYFYEFNDEALKKSKALQSWRYVTEMLRCSSAAVLLLQRLQVSHSASHGGPREGQ